MLLLDTYSVIRTTNHFYIALYIVTMKTIINKLTVAYGCELLANIGIPLYRGKGTPKKPNIDF